MNNNYIIFNISEQRKGREQTRKLASTLKNLRDLHRKKSTRLKSAKTSNQRKAMRRKRAHKKTKFHPQRSLLRIVAVVRVHRSKISPRWTLKNPLGLRKCLQKSLNLDLRRSLRWAPPASSRGTGSAWRTPSGKTSIEKKLKKRITLLI